MAQSIISLSGKAGLTRGFHGDLHTLTPTPQYIYDVKDGELAYGVYNPYLLNGYISPSTDSSTSMTINVAADTQFGSYEYDTDSGVIFVGDRVRSVYKLTDSVDTSFGLIDDIIFTSVPDKKMDELHDINIYQLNGEPKLFTVGKGLNLGQSQEIILGNRTLPTMDWGTVSVSIAPSGTTKPSIQAWCRDFVNTAGTSSTEALTIPSGSNQVLVVIAMWDGSSTGPTATWNGTPLISQANYTVSVPLARVWTLASPQQGTYNIEVTWGSSTAHRLFYAFVVDNAYQNGSEGLVRSERRYLTDTFDYTTNDPLNVYYAIDPTSENALNVVVGMVEDESITGVTVEEGSSTRVSEATNGWDASTGSDFLYVVDYVGYGLSVHATDLDFINFGTNTEWLMQQAAGSFVHDITTKYAFIRNADNGFAYLFADNAIHKIDGTTTGGEYGTVTKNVILFPSNFTITDAVDYRSRLYIALTQYQYDASATNKINFPGKCGIFVWNRVSTQLTSTDYIELAGVKEIKKIYSSPDGVLKLITVSDNGQTELRQFGYNDSGGVVFPVVATFGIGGFPQYPDGLSVSGDKAMWLATDGNVYCEKENKITIPYQAKAPGSTTTTVIGNISPGVIIPVSGGETSASGFRDYKQGFVLSYLDGATHTLEKIYPFDIKNGSDSTQTPNVGNVYTAVQYLPVGSVARNVRIYNAPVSTTGTDVIATVKLYFNQKTTASRPSGMTKSITKNEAKRGYVDFRINEPYVNAIQIEIEWATGQAIGYDAYMPSVAVITYDETTLQSPDGG